LTTPAFGQRPGPRLLKRWDLTKNITAPGRAMSQLGIKSVTSTVFKHEIVLHLGCGNTVIFDLQTGAILAADRAVSNEKGINSSCWVPWCSSVYKTNSSSSEIVLHEYTNKLEAGGFQQSCIARQCTVRKKTKDFNFCLPFKVLFAAKGQNKLILDQDPSRYLDPKLISKANKIKVFDREYKVKQIQDNSIIVEPALEFNTEDLGDQTAVLCTNFEVFPDCIPPKTCQLSSNDGRPLVIAKTTKVSCLQIHHLTKSILCGQIHKEIIVLTAGRVPSLDTS